MDLVSSIIFSFQRNPVKLLIWNKTSTFMCIDGNHNLVFLIQCNLLFSGLTVIKRPAVKKALGIPIIPVAPTPPPTGEQKPAFSFFDAVKKYAAAQAEAQRQKAVSSSSSPAAEASKPATQRIPSSSSVISEKLKTLEKEVKGRKKGKKKY